VTLSPGAGRGGHALSAKDWDGLLLKAVTDATLADHLRHLRTLGTFAQIAAAF